jgi:hypothetical protein
MDLSDDERLRFVDELARTAQTGELAAVSALRRCFRVGNRADHTACSCARTRRFLRHSADREHHLDRARGFGRSITYSAGPTPA